MTNTALIHSALINSVLYKAGFSNEFFSLSDDIPVVLQEAFRETFSKVTSLTSSQLARVILECQYSEPMEGAERLWIQEIIEKIEENQPNTLKGKMEMKRIGFLKIGLAGDNETVMWMTSTAVEQDSEGFAEPVKDIPVFKFDMEKVLDKISQSPTDDFDEISNGLVIRWISNGKDYRKNAVEVEEEYGE